MTRLALLLSLFLAARALNAQNATISRFHFWTADTAYSIWSDTSTVYVFNGPDGAVATVPTADTIYNYTITELNKALDCTIETLNVDGTIADGGPERITGFPDRKVKHILADGKFGLIVEVEAQMTATWRKPPSGRGPNVRAFSLRVTVETFDGRGNRTAKYMDRATHDQVTDSKAWQTGFDRRTGLTGAQLFDLYKLALKNALATKR